MVSIYNVINHTPRERERERERERDITGKFYPTSLREEINHYPVVKLYNENKASLQFWKDLN